MSIARSWQTIDSVLKEQSIETYRSLNGPVSARDIKQLEKEFSLKLPLTYVNSLKIHNGTLDHEFLNYMSLLDARAVVSWLNIQREVQSQHEFNGRKTPANSRTRKDERWRQKWLPIAADDGGNLILIDLDPGPAGQRGQIVRWNNTDSRHRVLSESFAMWLKTIATELSGKRFSVDRFGDIVLKKGPF